MNQKIPTWLVCLSLAGLLFFTGCVSHGLFQGYNTANNRASLSANDYLQLANAAQGQKKQQYLLLAADRLTHDRNYNTAQNILNRVTVSDLDPEMTADKQIIQADIWSHTNRLNDALNLLNRASASNVTLSAPAQIQLHTVLANIYQMQGNVLASLDQRTEVLSLSPRENKQTALLQTWEYLQRQSNQTLQNLQTTATNDNQRGWLSLALLSEGNVTPQPLMQALNQWQQRYSNHPASALLGNLQSLKAMMPTLPQHIALLLPLKGPLAAQANAIRNGFFAAYYASAQKPTITVLDTSSSDVVTLYQQAVQQGANFIVGPLTKENLAKLVNASVISVPTLALNTLPSDNSRVNHLYQFGLSPTDEATQTAVKAWNDHHNRMIIIAPQGEWGGRIANTFAQQWQALGGRITAELNYTTRANLNTDIQSLLNIDKSQRHESALSYLLKEKIRFVPRRRNDFDAIFLVGTPDQAREIVPLLRFYYAGNVPIYATSSIYTGSPRPGLDRDLDGIIFDDMPWVLQANNALASNMADIRDRIHVLWQNSANHNVRFFALGADAYNLIPQLGKLTLLPQFSVNGATGMLYLLPNQHVYRKLVWAQIRGGTPHPLGPS